METTTSKPKKSGRKKKEKVPFSPEKTQPKPAEVKNVTEATEVSCPPAQVIVPPQVQQWLDKKPMISKMVDDFVAEGMSTIYSNFQMTLKQEFSSDSRVTFALSAEATNSGKFSNLVHPISEIESSAILGEIKAFMATSDQA